jgi:colanic acid/amylovoran biosynthesis glycosyltransferase
MDTSDPNRQQRRVCVVSPDSEAYSQTFVRAHKERLPAKVLSLFVPDYDNFSSDNGPLVKPELAARLSRAILRRSLKLDAGYFQQRALRKFLLANNIEAVLAEFGPAATVVMDACREAAIPLVAHFHGFDAYRRSTLDTFGKRYGELFQNAAAIIAVSRDMREQLLSLGAPAEKVHYNSCGVDPSIFRGADPANSPPTFVAVGRFVDKKAPQLSLLAFKQVLEAVPEARLIMIGDGPLWEACYQMIRALDMSHAVTFPGARPQNEVADAMQHARAFVQHSVRTRDGDSEGTPVAVLEAGASSLAVVATRHAGIKDAVVDGKTGLLVDEGDIDAMAGHMTRLAREPKLAADLGKAAREWISAEYSMEKSINTLWTIIETSITRRSRARPLA